MKTLLLKNGMPVATAVLAIAGAFATTSMQNSSGAFGQKVGYTIDFLSGECAIATLCSDVPHLHVCLLWYPFGPRAYEKNPATGNCVNMLYRFIEQP